MDCCGDDMVCHSGFCLEPSRYEDSALRISDDGQFAEWVADDAMEGEIYGISKSLQIAIVLVVLVCAMCCGLVFWVKTGRRKRRLPPPPPRKRTQESAHSSQIVDIYSVRDRRRQ